MGHDEDPFSLMDSVADFTRAEYAPRRFITSCFQVANDFSESKGDVSFDVFKEALNRSNCVDDFEDVGPEVSGVILSFSFSRLREWLTGIASSNNVNSVSKDFRREGFKIRVNRCGIQEILFHLCDQVFDCEGFDLHITDDSMAKSGKLKSSLDSTVSAA